MSRTLTVDDVKKLIEKARGVMSDPGGVLMGVFEGLGESASVSGEVLQQALMESGIPLPTEATNLLGGMQAIEREGDKVQIALGSQLQPVLHGTQLRLGPTIAFALQKFPDGAALADLTGIQVNKFVWIDIQRVQFHDREGKRSVRVDTNFGGKEFDLP